MAVPAPMPLPAPVVTKRKALIHIINYPVIYPTLTAVIGPCHYMPDRHLFHGKSNLNTIQFTCNWANNTAN